MKLEYDFTTVRKLSAWARDLSDNIDFIDYWYNLYLSHTKHQIEESIMNKINAFHWTRWQEDFEEYVDHYKPITGDGYFAQEREWFAMYMQYLVYAFQMPSRGLASYYGKDVFHGIMSKWFKYHTFGVDLFVEHIVTDFGKPPATPYIVRLHM